MVIPPDNTHPRQDGPELVVVGTGYVGLTSAACLASLGRSVTAIDIDAAKIDALDQGHVPIVEAGLEALVDDGLTSGRLRFSSSYDACRHADMILLCLPTPHHDRGGLDLSFLRQAATTLRLVAPAGAIVVTKSTVPAGTHAELASWLDRPDVAVASNPEFLREGTAVDDFLNPDRIVIGAADDQVARAVAAMYDGIDAPVQLTDPASAELIKYAANSFLATKLGFINEISRLCDSLGADIADVAAGVGSDHRIGTAFLQPGPGWGGSCFPKDTRGLAHVARRAGRQLPIVEAAFASNGDHVDHIAAEITDLCPPPIVGARIAVWGATFKAGTDDVRDSPAVEIVNRLSGQGADVVVYDPAAARSLVPATTADDPYSACLDADLLVVLTEWAEFGQADLEKVAHLMRGTVVYDTRYVVEPTTAAEAGLMLRQPGRRPLERPVLGPMSDGCCDS